MNTIKENDLSFYNEQGVLTLNAKQYDTGRIFVFNILDDDEPFDLSGCIASLRIKKADGKQFLGTECCTTDGYKIIVNTSIGNGNQILTADGINECELHLEDLNGITLTTWNFNINVQKRVHNGEHISSLDSFDFIDNMVNLEKERIKNEEQRKQNENDRINNEDLRLENEDARIENEKHRQKNESERIANEDERIAEFDDMIDEANTTITNCNLVIKRAEETIDNFDKNINDIVDGITDEARKYAEDAKTSKNAAAISEINSKESETKSKESELATIESEKNAKASEIAAKDSETESKKSELAAADSEINSANSATIAGQKANDASDSAAIATNKADDASNYADKSKSYAVGTGGVVRPNDDTDCAGYFYEQSKRILQGFSGVIPMGSISFDGLADENNQKAGYMFNISDSFVSDERFNDGGGIFYGAGNNVLYTADGKWDVLSASMVSGVKGNAENEYRQGFVDIGSDNIEYTNSPITYNSIDASLNNPEMSGMSPVNFNNVTLQEFIDKVWNVLIPKIVDNLHEYVGVKGNAESTYRTGNVNLTPANIGAITQSELNNRVNVRHIFGFINGSGETTSELAALGISKDLTVLENFNKLPDNTVAVINNNAQETNYSASFPGGFKGRAQLVYRRYKNTIVAQFFFCKHLALAHG